MKQSLNEQAVDLAADYITPEVFRPNTSMEEEKSLQSAASTRNRQGTESNFSRPSKSVVVLGSRAP